MKSILVVDGAAIYTYGAQLLLQVHADDDLSYDTTL